MWRGRSWVVSGLAVGSFTMHLFSGPSARAADTDAAALKRACIEASESAQQLRIDGKLVEAQKQLVMCASDVCPGAIRVDCASWLSQVNALMPSVVLVARDGAGEDLADVTVTMDGKPLTTHLDGKSISVGPGEHVFRFERTGSGPIEKRVIMREGETARKIEVTLGGAGSGTASSGTASSGAASEAQGPRSPSGPGVLPWILVGVGAATAIAGGVLYAIGTKVPPDCANGSCKNYFDDGTVNNTPSSAVRDPATGSLLDCATHNTLDGCSQSAKNRQRQSDAGTADGNRVFGVVGMIGGGVVMAGGLVYYFVARPSSSEKSASMPRLVPLVTDTTRGLAVGGAF